MLQRGRRVSDDFFCVMTGIYYSFRGNVPEIDEMHFSPEIMSLDETHEDSL